MSEVVRCGRCGVRYDGRHAKCPRCRGHAPLAVTVAGMPSPAAAVPLGRLGAVILGLVVVTATLIWAVQPAYLAEAKAEPPAAGLTRDGRGPLAVLAFAQETEPTVSSDRVPSELPFVDSTLVARQSYRRGEYDAALERFKEEISLHPTDPSACSNAGQVLIRMGQPADAIPFLEKAVALSPGQWTFRFNLARGHGAVGNWDRAAAEYQEAARLFPEDYATTFNLAQALHRAGREDEAVARYRDAIALKPDDASFQLALGVSEEKLGQLAEAVAAYRRFVEMAPEAKEAEGVKARVERLEKDLAAAPAATPPPAPGER